MNSLNLIDKNLQQLNINYENFNTNEKYLKDIIPLFPFLKNNQFKDSFGTVTVIPLGICMNNKRRKKIKLHFNLLLFFNKTCLRIEPYEHVTIFYNETKLNSYLKERYEYKIMYGNKTGTTCIQDSFDMLNKFLENENRSSFTL